MAENTRAFYRVEYPVRERPVLQVGEHSMEVIECSESGLSFELTSRSGPPAPAQKIIGVVRFGDRAEVSVEGVVVRVDEESAAVRLTGATIPFAVILSEQKYLRRHYHARYR